MSVGRFRARWRRRIHVGLALRVVAPAVVGWLVWWWSHDPSVAVQAAIAVLAAFPPRTADTGTRVARPQRRDA